MFIVSLCIFRSSHNPLPFCFNPPPSPPFFSFFFFFFFCSKIYCMYQYNKIHIE
ncbi:hypothetical protein MUCCIDRAFT_171498, partial [Mucor lusitanicus CBS 277.49]